MLKAIFDANALITICKFTIDQELLIDLLLRSCQIWLPQEVAEEAALNLQYPDAQAAEQRVKAGSLSVEASTVPAPAFWEAYQLGSGEKAAIRLYLSKKRQIRSLK